MVMKKGNNIEVKELSFGYLDYRILHEISLSISPGTVTTLAGPNGCGKTTLLRLLSGFLKPGSGEIWCAGISVPDSHPSDISRVTGYVPQSGVSSFPYSVLDVVLCGRIPYLQPWEQPSATDVHIARSCIDRLGISYLEEKLYTCLSGGERQLVMIARALCQDPAVLLLDEPTSSLDLKNQIQVLEIVNRLATKENITVVMTLHDPNHAYIFSDQIVLLKKCSDYSGENNIVSFGHPDEVMTPDNIFHAYGVQVTLIPYGRRNIIIPYSHGRLSGDEYQLPGEVTDDICIP
jgi:iron complex transport system ATP-binding protein